VHAQQKNQHVLKQNFYFFWGNTVKKPNSVWQLYYPDSLRFFSSACQYFDDWEGARRLYSYMMAQNMKNLILRNENMLLKDPEMSACKSKIQKVTSLKELDEVFNR